MGERVVDVSLVGDGQMRIDVRRFPAPDHGLWGGIGASYWGPGPFQAMARILSEPGTSIPAHRNVLSDRRGRAGPSQRHRRGADPSLRPGSGAKTPPARERGAPAAHAPDPGRSAVSHQRLRLRGKDRRLAHTD